jgi:hypothetical protein
MFDQMHLKTYKKLDWCWLNSLPRSQVATLRDSFYQRAYRVDLRLGVSVTLKGLPNFTGPSESAIELNPSKWICWEEIKSTLEKIAPLESFAIKRLDHAVDRPESIAEVFETMRVKYKREKDKYGVMDGLSGRKISGSYFGVERERILVYDKAYELRKGSFKQLSGTEVGVCTRFELRQKHNRVPFKNLESINCYLDYNPFEQLEFYKLRQDLSLDESKMLSQRVKDLGMNDLYSELNAKNNLAKIRSKIFVRMDYDQTLLKDYQSNLSKFLGVKSKVEKNREGVA